MNKRGSKKIVKTFKDYIVPIAIVAILAVFLLNYVFSSRTTTIPLSEQTPIEVQISDKQNSEIYVEYAGGNKEKLNSNTQIMKGEKISVAKGDVVLSLPENGGKLKLNKLGELKYNEDGGFNLYTSDLWGNVNSSINVEMNYAKVYSNKPAVFSLSQNEVASTIYVLQGVLEVENLVGKQTVLQKNEKLVIMRNAANDDKVDLSIQKEPLDDMLKEEDWFIKNDGNYYLSLPDIQTASGTLNGNPSGVIVSSSGIIQETNSGSENINNIWQESNSNYITFHTLRDEFESTTDTIQIDGTILDTSVNRIEINGISASIDSGAKTFLLKDFKLKNKVNDIVYKIYDDSSNLLYKGVMTVYNAGATSVSSSTGDQGLAQVNNYPISTSPLYQIISPKQNPYTTSEKSVRIEGAVPARTVERIVVNGFQLRKFPKYGSYWYYFANSDNGNLKEGVNIYEIQYFGEGDKLIYENNFTIIKNTPIVEPPVVNEVPNTPPVEKTPIINENVIETVEKPAQEISQPQTNEGTQ